MQIRPHNALDALERSQDGLWRGSNNLSYWSLFFLLLLASGVFDDKGGNPIGLPYVAELTEISLLLFSGLMIANSILFGALNRIDFLVLTLVIGAWLMSSINAYLWYSQPLVYGLIEDRRILMTLIYFPVVYLIRNRKVDHNDVVVAILAVASIAILSSVMLILLGLVGEQEEGVTRLNYREDRLSIGTHVVIIATFLAFSFAQIKTKYRMYWMAWLVASYGTLLLIVQTRKIILVASMLMLIYAIKRRSSRWVIMGGGFFCGVGLILFWPTISSQHFVIKAIAVWGQLFNEDYLTSGYRAHTIATIWESLKGYGLFWGKGALSLSWQDGFHRIFGEYFYLADVGIAGMFFRYGILVSLLFIVLSTYIAYVAFKQMNDIPLKRVVGIGLLFVFLSPGAGIFLYAGLEYGLLLGMAVGLSKSYVDYRPNLSR